MFYCLETQERKKGEKSKGCVNKTEIKHVNRFGKKKHSSLSSRINHLLNIFFKIVFFTSSCDFFSGLQNRKKRIKWSNQIKIRSLAWDKVSKNNCIRELIILEELSPGCLIFSDFPLPHLLRALSNCIF